MTAPKLSALYTAEVRRELSHLAAWRPGDQVRLGDIGTMDGDRFRPHSTLKKAVDIAVGRQRVAEAGEVKYRSAGAVALSLGVGASAPDPSGVVGKASADIEVSFSRENAVLIDLYGCRAKRIEDQLSLQEQLLAEWKKGTWRPEWCAIVEIVEAESATVLISSAKDARVGFTATVGLASEEIALAGADLKLQRTHSKGIGLEMLTEPGATPLMKGLRLKKSFWSKDPKVVIEGLEPVGDEESAEDAILDAFDLLGDD